MTLTGTTVQDTSVANGITNVGWAIWVLQDGGYPVTVNNVNNLVSWMTAENGASNWTAGSKNNPLNNGLGSGGGDGTGSYPDLATAAQYAAKGVQGGISGAAPIGQALAANAPFAVFHAATIQADWSGDHYSGTDWLNATGPYTVPVVSSADIKAASAGVNSATGDALQGVAGAGNTAVKAASAVTTVAGDELKFLDDLTSATWWERIGMGVLGAALFGIGLAGFISTTKPGQQATSDAGTAVKGAAKDAATAAIVA